MGSSAILVLRGSRLLSTLESTLLNRYNLLAAQQTTAVCPILPTAFKGRAGIVHNENILRMSDCWSTGCRNFLA